MAKRLIKFDSIKKKRYLAYISKGHTRGYAATLVGIHRGTVVNHMNKHQSFANAVSEAEGDASGKVVNALYKEAISGNMTAIQVYLYNRDPEQWRDKRNTQADSNRQIGNAEVSIVRKIEIDADMLDRALAVLVESGALRQLPSDAAGTVIDVEARKV